jgi:DNA-binding HxlR family transcriptional regulator
MPSERTSDRSGADADALDAAVTRIGDRWSLLVVHALLEGPRRFNELQAAITGIAPNVLSARLKHLDHVGVVVAERYSERPPRFAYRLTASGFELAGALRLLAQWGADLAPGTEPVHHAACGTPVEARWYCPTCAQVVDPGDTTELRYA